MNMEIKSQPKMKLLEPTKAEVIKKLTYIDYSTYCKLFSSKYDDVCVGNDMKGSFKVLKDYIHICIKNNFITPQSYKPSKDSPDGRLFVQGAGIQKLPKLLRGILCDGIYTDFDMINAHPTILLNICQDNDIECDKLQEYIMCRDIKLNDLMNTDDMSREDAKVCFIKSLNDERTYDSFFKDGKKRKIKNRFFKEFDSEVKSIQNSLCRKNKNIERNLRKLGETDNLKGKLINRLMCKGENDILQRVIDAKIIDILVLMFDGFMSPVVDNEEEIIEKLNKLTTDVGIKWSVKEHNISALDGFNEIEESNKIYMTANNTNQLATKLLEKDLKDIFTIKDSEYYYKTKKCWIKGEKEVKRHLYQLCNDNDFIVNDNPVNESYKLCNEVKEILCNLCRTDIDVRKRVWDSSVHKICFNNGYYDFKEMEFKTDNNVDTFFRINRDLNLKSNPKIRKAIYDRLLDPIFTTKVKGRDKLRDLWLHTISCRIAGEIRKDWYVFQGERDCGKGALGDLLYECLGSYVGISNVENFKTKHNPGDVAKSLSWVANKEFCKLIICNETEEQQKGVDTTLSGNVIKKITGGDVLELRTNNVDEYYVKLMGAFMFNCNDMPEIKPIDANTTRKNYTFISQFVSDDDEQEDDSIHYYKRDDNIKDHFCKDKEVCNEFFLMLIDAYKAGLPEVSNEIKEGMKYNMLEDSQTTIYKRYFEKGDENDRVTNKELTVFINSNEEVKSLGSKGKILDALKRRFNCVDYKSKGVRGLKGLKINTTNIE